MNDFDDFSDHRHNDSDCDSLENWELQNSRNRTYSIDKPQDEDRDSSYTSEIIAVTNVVSPQLDYYKQDLVEELAQEKEQVIKTENKKTRMY